MNKSTADAVQALLKRIANIHKNDKFPERPFKNLRNLAKKGSGQGTNYA